MDEKALTSFGETCLATANLIQNLLDYGDMGNDADRSLSDHHVALTRKSCSLAEKKRALSQQQFERNVCEKYASVNNDDFFDLYDSMYVGQFAF